MPSPATRFCIGLLVLATSASLAADQKTAPPPLPGPEKVAAEHLPNAYRVHERVISGGLPDGNAAFEELQSLGVKTVISVDGARPDVATAARYGMRYVHLPHGYDGIPADRIAELAKAVRDLPGPVYIHCHHGRHRSPAAAAAACVATGLIPPESVLGILTAAGTSRNYRGLYETAQSTKRLDDKVLDDLPADFPETAELPEMAEAMVRIEHVHDHLREFAAGNWRAIQDKPDLDPPHEALLLREHFTELLRTPAAKEQSAGFQKLLRESEKSAAALEEQLRARRHAAAGKMLEQITQQCAACHREYRDVPLSEKRSPGQ